jgi:DNA polymerase IV
MSDSSSKKVYFHVDLDAFYASVEQTDNPEYKGKPVIIGALPGHRGVVAACSYEARAFGVRSAMPISEAYRRCRKGVYLIPRMKRYHEISKKIIALFFDFTPEVYQISIDEASLDMTGTDRLFGSAEEAARQIKARVCDETSLTISIGIAPSRYLAKLASEFDKPDGLVSINEGEEERFLDKLELKDLWGLGKKTLERLDELNITSVPALRSIEKNLLQAMLGKAAGAYLHSVVTGVDPGIYSQAPKSRSISSETTFENDTRSRETLRKVLLDLSHQIMFRLLEEELRSKTVTLKLRYSDFLTTTSQTTLRHFISSAEEMFEIAMDLLEKRWNGSDLIRLVGLGLSAIEKSAEPAQSELFEDGFDRKKKVEKTVLSIKKKNKANIVVKASLLRPKKSDKKDDVR